MEYYTFDKWEGDAIGWQNLAAINNRKMRSKYSLAGRERERGIASPLLL